MFSIQGISRQTLGTIVILIIPCIVSGTSFTHSGTSDTDITAIGMPSDTEVANLGGNRFGDHPNGIPVSFLYGFPNLRSIILRDNNLAASDVGGYVFNGVAATLTYLDLCCNSLATIYKDTLTNLRLLNYLNLNVNQITSIPSGR